MYLNEVNKNEKKEAEAKKAEAEKPTIEEYAKKLSDTFLTGKLFVIIQINQDQLVFILSENTINGEKKKSLTVFSTNEIFYP